MEVKMPPCHQDVFSVTDIHQTFLMYAHVFSLFSVFSVSYDL